MIRSVYIDAAVGIYAIGSESPAKEECIRLLDRAGKREVRLHASVEMIQEFCHHRMRRVDRATAVAQTEHLMSLTVLHAFDQTVLEESLHLIETTAVRGRDAVHAATAIVHHVPSIVSPDHDFDGVPGLTRLDPGEV